MSDAAPLLLFLRRRAELTAVVAEHAAVMRTDLHITHAPVAAAAAAEAPRCVLDDDDANT